MLSAGQRTAFQTLMPKAKAIHNESYSQLLSALLCTGIINVRKVYCERDPIHSSVSSSGSSSSIFPHHHLSFLLLILIIIILSSSSSSGRREGPHPGLEGGVRGAGPGGVEAGPAGGQRCAQDACLLVPFPAPSGLPHRGPPVLLRPRAPGPAALHQTAEEDEVVGGVICRGVFGLFF